MPESPDKLNGTVCFAEGFSFFNRAQDLANLSNGHRVPVIDAATATLKGVFEVGLPVTEFEPLAPLQEVSALYLGRWHGIESFFRPKVEAHLAVAAINRTEWSKLLGAHSVDIYRLVITS